MVHCERCKELEEEIGRLTMKAQNTRKWVIAKAPLQEYLKLVGMIYIRLIDKFAILNNSEKSYKEIASLAAEFSEALYDELYNRKERED